MRELVVLGTSSQVPTRHRNHNGYLLRWEQEGLLFDPGEGTQRQLIHAGVTPTAITRVLVTHFHGDHSLGLAGILQRLNLDGAAEVRVYFPAEDAVYFERLRDASRYDRRLVVTPVPVSGDPFVEDPGGAGLRIEARPLDHPAPTYGYRVSEPDTFGFIPEELARRGLAGPLVGELARAGAIEWQGETVRLEDVSERRPGMRFAFVMDTRPCPAAVELARAADLLVMESTFLEDEAEEARAYSHSTARGAAQVAAAAGARRLILGHFSQRYEDLTPFHTEASALHPDVTIARDLQHLPLPWGRKISVT